MVEDQIICQDFQSVDFCDRNSSDTQVVRFQIFFSYSHCLVPLSTLLLFNFSLFLNIPGQYYKIFMERNVKMYVFNSLNT